PFCQTNDIFVRVARVPPFLIHQEGRLFTSEVPESRDYKIVCCRALNADFIAPPLLPLTLSSIRVDRED
ncbi:hypothetical protein BgiBS90_004787, partial [Biomphalaria glabrata]